MVTVSSVTRRAEYPDASARRRSDKVISFWIGLQGSSACCVDVLIHIVSYQYS